MATHVSDRHALLETIRRLYPAADPEQTFNEDDYLHSYGRPASALLYVTLFCPPLIEIDGSILLRRAAEHTSARERFRAYLKEKGGDRAAAESSFNFSEIAYWLGAEGRDTADGDDRVLADFLADAWTGWLMKNYPSRSFHVAVLDPDETGSVTGLTFYEIESSPDST